MLNRFFISLGSIFLSVFDFFTNFSFKRKIKSSSNDEEGIPSIFNRLNFENPSKSNVEEDRFEEFREKSLQYFKNRGAVGIFAITVFLIGLFFGVEVFLMILVITAIFYFYMLNYPKIKLQKSYDDLNQELPYALRHIGIELKSGKGLHDALITIKNSDYGSLSKEFSRVLEEVKYGKSTEDSLLEMSGRINSEGLSRTIQQIVGTLRVGGNLANNLEVIAKDITFDMHIKLKEYSQKLNSFILIYTFLAILIPVISLVMMMAATTVMGDVVPGNVLLMVYSLFFPLVVVFMGIFIKKMEPKI